VCGPPWKGLGMCRRLTNKGESGFGIANSRGTVAVEWKHHQCDRLKQPRVLSMDQCYLHVKTVFLGGGWDPKVPVGSPVSLPKRPNQAWRLVAPSSPCRINTKSKHQKGRRNVVDNAKTIKYPTTHRKSLALRLMAEKRALSTHKILRAACASLSLSLDVDLLTYILQYLVKL
jgi:hypothetical protein